MSRLDFFTCVPRFEDVAENLSRSMNALGVSSRAFTDRILPGRRDETVPLVVVSDNFDYDPLARMGNARQAILMLSERYPADSSPHPNADRRFRDLEKAKGAFALFLAYSTVQARFLASRGYRSVEVVRWPFESCCRKIEIGKCVDALFLGRPSERRTAIIDALRGSGIRVETSFDFDGDDKVVRLNTAKIVLNIHYEEGGNFEAKRILDAMVCGALVVTEAIDSDEFMDGEHLVVADASSMASRIQYYLSHTAEREALAARGRVYAAAHHSGVAVAHELGEVLVRHGILRAAPHAPCVEKPAPVSAQEEMPARAREAQRTLEGAYAWRILRDQEKEKTIGELHKAREGFLGQIEGLHNALAHERSGREALHAECAAQSATIRELRPEAEALRHELNSIRLSKQWKIASAILDARRSPAALLRLPFRILGIGFGRNGTRCG